MRPNIQLHIERLILDGLPVSRTDGAVVQAAIETELTRLLTEGGLPRISAGSVENISGGRIQLMPETNPTQTGYQIAGALMEGIGNHNKLNNKRKGN